MHWISDTIHSAILNRENNFLRTISPLLEIISSWQVRWKFKNSRMKYARDVFIRTFHGGTFSSNLRESKHRQGSPCSWQISLEKFHPRNRVYVHSYFEYANTKAQNETHPVRPLYRQFDKFFAHWLSYARRTFFIRIIFDSYLVKKCCAL